LGRARALLGLALCTVVLILAVGFSVMVEAEDEAPSVSLNTYPKYTNVRSATFTGTATQANSPVASVEYTIDSGSWNLAAAVAVPFGDSTAERYSFTIGALSDGPHTVQVKATTKAGYTTAPADYATAVFYVDTVKPSISLMPLSPDPCADSTPTLFGTTQDSYSPIAAVEYRIDDGAWTSALAVDGAFDSMSENYTFTTSALSDGSHVAQVRATDAAGNVSASASDDFAIDATAPSLTINTVPEYVNESTLVFSGIATDALTPVSSAHYCLDGGCWLAATALDGVFDEMAEEYTFTVGSLVDGSHTLEVRALDVLGNVTAASDYPSAHFIVDTTAPLVSVNDIPDSVNQLNEVSGTASDAPLGVVKKVKVLISRGGDRTVWDGSAWVDSENWLEAVGATGWNFPMPALSAGQTYTVRAKSVDAAGNESIEASDSFNVAAIPESPNPDEGAVSHHSTAIWIWILFSGLGVLALAAVFVVGRKVKDRF
jgi:hypothetical protein